MSELVERLKKKAIGLRALGRMEPSLNFDETAAFLDEAAAALSRADETEAAWERSRDLVTGQCRVVANALPRAEAELELAVEQLFCAEAQRDALAKALSAARDWIVKTEVDEAYDLEGPDIQSDLLELIDTALAAAADTSANDDDGATT